MTNLWRISRPPNDKFMFIYSDNLELIRLSTGSQNDTCLLLPPIDMPKYTIGSFENLQFNTDVASFNLKSLTLTPMKKLLRKFTFKPDTA